MLTKPETQEVKDFANRAAREYAAAEYRLGQRVLRLGRTVIRTCAQTGGLR